MGRVRTAKGSVFLIGLRIKAKNAAALSHTSDLHPTWKELRIDILSESQSALQTGQASCCYKAHSKAAKRLIHPHSFLEEKLDVAPSKMRLVKLFSVLFSALHLCACFFWRVKVRVLHLQVAKGNVKVEMEGGRTFLPAFLFPSVPPFPLLSLRLPSPSL